MTAHLSFIKGYVLLGFPEHRRSKYEHLPSNQNQCFLNRRIHDPSMVNECKKKVRRVGRGALPCLESSDLFHPYKLDEDGDEGWTMLILQPSAIIINQMKAS